MPPRRQHRIYADDAPTSQEIALASRQRQGPSPLNEGFARPIQQPASQAAGSSLSSAASSSAWVPPRADGQEVQAYARGSKRVALQVASNPALLQDAAKELRAKAFARTTQGPLAAKLSLWEEVANAAGYSEPYALDSNMLYDVAAALWKGGYRSLDSYLSAAKQQMTLEHGSLSDAFGIHLRRISRAAARGRGPAKQAQELPFGRLAELDFGATPLTPGGPCYPLRLIVVAVWWLLREIEVANLTLSCATFSEHSATLRLPASKADTQGAGTARSLGCSCSAGQALMCPMHTLQKQHHWATGEAQRLMRPLAGFPLFPGEQGGAPSKQAVVALIQVVAASLGLPLATESGAPRFTGHSCRVTGAMHLAASGIDVWRIQLHGRWGSDAVLRYIRLSPLSSSMAMEATLGRDLAQVQEKLKAAKAQLSQAQSTVSFQSDKAEMSEETLTELLGDQLARDGGVLGPVTVDQVLSYRKGWKRQPYSQELLVANETTQALHSFRPPLVWQPSMNMDEMWTDAQTHEAKTWCGWAVTAGRTRRQHKQSMLLWDPELVPPCQLCEMCFGKQTDDDISQSSGSSGS